MPGLLLWIVYNLESTYQEILGIVSIKSFILQSVNKLFLKQVV